MSDMTSQEATTKAKRTRVSKTAKTLAAQAAEIARLKAALANPGRTADAMVADAPGAGIKILGMDEPTPKVTGGMTRKQQEDKAFGKQWWCKVVELQLPFAKDVHQVATWCRGGQRVQLFRANTEVLLPESEINKLENECVVVDEQRVNVGHGGMTIDRAHEMANAAGMNLEHDQFGNYFYRRVTPRFSVQRLRPEQESITLS